MAKVMFKDDLDELLDNMDKETQATEQTTNQSAEIDTNKNFEGEKQGTQNNKGIKDDIEDLFDSENTIKQQEPKIQQDTGQKQEENTNEEELDKIFNELLSGLNEIENTQEDITDIVEQSNLPDKEKEELRSKLSEQDNMILELQRRYDMLKEKYATLASEKEDIELNNIMHSKILAKYTSDPDVQEFIALKIKSDNGDEFARNKFEEYLKDKLAEFGYDLNELIAKKRRKEKQAISNKNYFSDLQSAVDETDELEMALYNM